MGAHHNISPDILQYLHLKCAALYLAFPVNLPDDTCWLQKVLLLSSGKSGAPIGGQRRPSQHHPVLVLLVHYS